MKINFNTEEGQAIFTTPIIEDKLDCIIVSCNSELPISIIIRSQLGYEILQVRSHKGVKYYAPRAIEQGPIAKLINQDQFCKFNLNEPLDIIISGPKNVDVEMWLRFS